MSPLVWRIRSAYSIGTHALGNIGREFAGLFSADSKRVIFQFGRVGSIALRNAAREALPGQAVYHLHWIHTKGRGYRRFWPARSFKEWVVGRVLMARKSNIDLDVITPVRDPVARCVSMFGYDVPKELNHESVEVDRLLDFFWSMSAHKTVFRWFDDEIRPTLGIDVCDHPFPGPNRVLTVSRDRWRWLVYRLEDIETVTPEIGRFLGVTDFHIPRVNESKAHVNPVVHRKFMDAIRFPASYLDRMYGSRFVRHFYTPAEIAAFRRRWEAV